MRQSIVACLVVAALAVLTAPVLAGGWATVRLDEEPGDRLAGVPWNVGFTVKQHDVTPTNDVNVSVRAVNTETGEEIMVAGVQNGPTGHFVAELTLPRAGEWKWAVYPAPFAETSFETLTVLDAASAALVQEALPVRRAVLIDGACAANGTAVTPLADVAQDVDDPSVADQLATKSSAAPVAVGSGKIDTPLAELLATARAIGIQESAKDTDLVACGDVVAAPDDEEVVVGLQQRNGSGQVGVAVIRAHGEDTVVNLYLVTVDGDSEALSAPLATATIEIDGGDGGSDWFFQPASLEIAPGTEVTWRNDSNAAHTITGDALAFADSGVLDPGDSFRQIFTEPGTYNFRCGPHPWMTGTIVVA